MTTSNVRGFIAIAMVVVFIGLTAVMALFPLFSSKNVDIKDYADFFVKIASVYTGILGVIVGYYFARVQGAQPTGETGSNASHRNKGAAN